MLYQPVFYFPQNHYYLLQSESTCDIQDSLRIFILRNVLFFCIFLKRRDMADKAIK